MADEAPPAVPEEAQVLDRHGHVTGTRDRPELQSHLHLLPPIVRPIEFDGIDTHKENPPALLLGGLENVLVVF